MKLVIQIPCFNEEQSLPKTLMDIPRSFTGIDEVEILIIDDGSTDKTIEVAKKMGIQHIVRHAKNQGLAKAFSSGLEASLQLDADIIVNTDADNQYCAEDIQKLIDPIRLNGVDIVVGNRPIQNIRHFSVTKKILQRLGSWIVKHVSGADINDAPSGFRAFSKKCAQKLHVFSYYTYTLETLIQAGKAGMVITSVPIRVNPEQRRSRLMRSIYSYVFKSAVTIIRIFIIYRPLTFFFTSGSLLIFLGLLVDLRFLYLYFTSSHSGHIQSLILSAVLLLSGFFLIIVGLIADLIAVNRRLLEEIDFRVKNIEYKLSKK